MRLFLPVTLRRRGVPSGPPFCQWQAEQSPGDGWVGSRCLASVYGGFQNACVVRIWKSGVRQSLTGCCFWSAFSSADLARCQGTREHHLNIKSRIVFQASTEPRPPPALNTESGTQDLNHSSSCTIGAEVDIRHTAGSALNGR